MRIRGSQTWCATCTAPEVWQAQVPWCALYLEALPAWQTGGLGDRLVEGFSRAEVLALLRLRGWRGARLAEAWEVLAEFEQETRAIRAARQAQAAGARKAGKGKG